MSKICKQQGRPSEASRELIELGFGRKVVHSFLPGSDVLPTCSQLQEQEEEEGLIKVIKTVSKMFEMPY